MRYLSASILLLVCASAAAQETETEKTAARDVLKKMAAIEQSLDVPGLVARLTGPDPARDEVVARAKELMDKELLALADDVATHPEIGFEEKRSVSKLTDYLRQHQFSIETGTVGLSTAFVAKYRRNNGGPNLGVIVEYDALRGTRGPFHGDQHSAQGPVGLAAAVAVAEYLTRTRTPGSVTVFGAPGEEMMPPNAKTEMHLAHAFDGMDILVRSHASSVTSRPAPGFGTCCLNIVGAKYTFSGAPAHQLQSWNGRNALEAVIHFFNNIDSVRSSIRPEPGKPQGYEETGSVSRDIPGVGFTAQSSTAPNHTYEMDADNLKEIGHKGFTIDAQAMAAVLFDFATHPEYRDAVRKEFEGIKALFGEYQAALKKSYTVPAVPEPR